MPTPEEKYVTMHANSTLLYDENTVLSALHDNLVVPMTQDLADKNPVFLSVLTGAREVMEKLREHFAFPFDIDEIKTSSYGHGTTAGTVQWLKKPSLDLRNRTVVIVDDIYDTGGTVQAITKLLQEEYGRLPEQIKVAVLLNKAVPRDLKEPDYAALPVEAGNWVYGFGMDCCGGDTGRSLPEIRIAHPELQNNVAPPVSAGALSFLESSAAPAPAEDNPYDTSLLWR